MRFDSGGQSMVPLLQMRLYFITNEQDATVQAAQAKTCLQAQVSIQPLKLVRYPDDST